MNEQKLGKDILRGIRVLLVEDEVGVSAMYTNGLRQYGASVTAVHDGVHALETLETHDVDIILMDLMMPRMNGYETLTKLRENERFDTVPVIVLSNLSRDRLREIEELQELGIYDFIIKSNIGVSALVSRIISCIKN